MTDGEFSPEVKARERVPDLPPEADTVWGSVAECDGEVHLRRFPPGAPVEEQHPTVQKAAELLGQRTEDGQIGRHLWACYLGERGDARGFGHDPEAAAHAALKDAQRRS